MILCKFDETGRRTSSVVEGINYKTNVEREAYIENGFIETSDDDYDYYVGNKGMGANGTGYIRGADGKPTDAPAHVPTHDEKLTKLNAEFAREKANLCESYTAASMSGDTETAESIAADMQDLNDWYDEEYAKIEEGSEE